MPESLDEPAGPQSAEQLGSESSSSSTSSDDSSGSQTSSPIHANEDDGDVTVFCLHKISKSVLFGGTKRAIVHIFPVCIIHKDFLYPHWAPQLRILKRPLLPHMVQTTFQSCSMALHTMQACYCQTRNERNHLRHWLPVQTFKSWIFSLERGMDHVASRTNTWR